VSLDFLFDEHLRGGPFRVVQRHNARGVNPINVMCVGAGEGVPDLGSTDAELLLWAEKVDRVVVTRDGRTMPAHLATHLASGRHSPGIMILRSVSFAQIVEFLVLAAHASQPVEWADCVTFIP
jgi:hypothetical protein